jgi:uncharacterized protein YndB with AHSA1/START domain
MNDSKFVYVTYIRTTREKLWDALTRPEFTGAYWCETTLDSTAICWRVRAPFDLHATSYGRQSRENSNPCFWVTDLG